MIKNINKVKKSNQALNIIIYAIVVVGFCLFLAPFILVLINSLKTKQEFIINPLSLPTTFDISNYITAFVKMDFLHSFMNSLIITVFSVIFVVLFASMTSHYILRNNNKFTAIQFSIMLAAMIIPFQAIMIPLVKIYGTLGVLNNRWTLIFMNIGFQVSMPVFLYHGFIKSVPLELEQAAMIDGCTPLKTFFLIVFPLLKPITMTVVILDSLFFWNDFLLPSLILTTESLRTLPLTTYKFFGTYTADYTLLMASLMMTMLPILILYIFLQKYIIEGAMQGAVKQ